MQTRKQYEHQIKPSVRIENATFQIEFRLDFNAKLYKKPSFVSFNHRLQGSLDLYHRYTDGALAPHILESGVSFFNSNIIDMCNRGFGIYNV